MACGGCGGGGGTRRLRVQKVPKSKSQKVYPPIAKVQKQVAGRVKTPPAPKSKVGLQSIKRQSLVRNNRCPKCQSTIMLVNIAGRERQQCTNITCKHVIK